MKAAREVVLGLGGVAVLTGIGSYDWRLALVVGGLVVMAGALHGLVRG